MIYREHFHHPEKLAHLIQMHNSNTSMIIRGLAQEILDDSHGDMHDLYNYFNEVYDVVYHVLLFRGLDIKDETRELLEILATPLFQKSVKEQKRIIKKYLG